MVQPPLLPASLGEGGAEQFAGLLHAEEPVLPRGLLVGVAGGDLHPVDLELVVEVVQHVDHGLRRVGVEERAVRVDLETGRLGLLDGGDGLVEHAFLADRLIVPLGQPVDVHHPGEVLRRRELVQVLGQQHALVHSTTNLRRLTSSLTISWICGCISGSPPASDTIGAPHSSTAATACSTGIRRLSSAAGCWIFPHPTHLRLHANSGSTSTIMGNFATPRSFIFNGSREGQRTCTVQPSMFTGNGTQRTTHRHVLILDGEGGQGASCRESRYGGCRKPRTCSSGLGCSAGSIRS